MKKLLVLLLAVPCMVLADKADTLLYVKLDPTNNVRYEVHDSYGSIYLQMWKIDSVEVDSNVRHTREVLENDINLPDTVIHNASYEEIIWMLSNPNKEIELGWIEFDEVYTAKPNVFPLYGFQTYKRGSKLFFSYTSEKDFTGFIAKPKVVIDPLPNTGFQFVYYMVFIIWLGLYWLCSGSFARGVGYLLGFCTLFVGWALFAFSLFVLDKKGLFLIVTLLSIIWGFFIFKKIKQARLQIVKN